MRGGRSRRVWTDKVAWDAQPRSGGSATPRRRRKLASCCIFSAAADSYSIDDPTLFFCVPAQSVSICSLEWGPNSPLKQNMAIGAGVGRASRNICTSRTSRSGVKLNRIPRRVGQKKNPQDCSVNYLTPARFNFLSVYPDLGCQDS